jgi:signal transduction histidine kinase
MHPRSVEDAYVDLRRTRSSVGWSHAIGPCCLDGEMVAGAMRGRVRTWGAARRTVLISGLLLVIGLLLAGARVGPRALPDSWGAGALVVVVLVAVHTARERRPVLVLGLVGCVLAAEIAVLRSVSIGSLIIAGDVAYIVGLRVAGRWVDLSAIVAGFAAVVGTLGLLSAGPQRPLVALAVTIGVAYAGSVWWGREVRRPRVALEHERVRSAAVAEASRARAGEAVVAERLRIARELHDAVAGSVSAIALQSTAALAVEDPSSERLRRTLEGTRTIALSALDELQQMIGVLRAGDAMGEGVHVVPDLDRAIDAARLQGTSVVVESVVPLDDLPRPVIAGVLRIAQEALTNAARHAPGCEVVVALDRDEESVGLVVRNAVATATRATDIGTGAGVAGMGERARSLGGTLTAGPRGGEWIVEARVPFAMRPSGVAS